MAEIIITEQNFEKEVLSSPQPVLLDFWAAWCGPCRQFAPVISQLAREYEGRVTVGTVNVDEESRLADQFHIANIPQVVLMKDGVLSASLVGLHRKDELEALLR